MKTNEDILNDFVNELKKLQDISPTPELALLVKYMSLIGLLGTMKEAERIRYVMNPTAMKTLTENAINDLKKLPAIARKYERNKEHYAN